MQNVINTLFECVPTRIFLHTCNLDLYVLFRYYSNEHSVLFQSVSRKEHDFAVFIRQ